MIGPAVTVPIKVATRDETLVAPTDETEKLYGGAEKICEMVIEMRTSHEMQVVKRSVAQQTMGEAGMKNSRARDVVGTFVSGYGDRFSQLYAQHGGDNSGAMRAYERATEKGRLASRNDPENRARVMVGLTSRSPSLASMTRWGQRDGGAGEGQLEKVEEERDIYTRPYTRTLSYEGGGSGGGRERARQPRAHTRDPYCPSNTNSTLTLTKSDRSKFPI